MAENEKELKIKLSASGGTAAAREIKQVTDAIKDEEAALRARLGAADKVIAETNAQTDAIHAEIAALEKRKAELDRQPAGGGGGAMAGGLAGGLAAAGAAAAGALAAQLIADVQAADQAMEKLQTSGSEVQAMLEKGLRVGGPNEVLEVAERASQTIDALREKIREFANDDSLSNAVVEFLGGRGAGARRDEAINQTRTLADIQIRAIEKRIAMDRKANDIAQMRLDGRTAEADEEERAARAKDIYLGVHEKLMGMDPAIQDRAAKAARDEFLHGETIKDQARSKQELNAQNFSAQEDERKWREQNAKEDAQFDNEKAAERAAAAKAARAAEIGEAGMYFQEHQRWLKNQEKEEAARHAAVMKHLADEKAALDSFNDGIDAQKKGLDETPADRAARQEAGRRDKQDERRVMIKERDEAEKQAEGFNKMNARERGEWREQFDENFKRKRRGELGPAPERKDDFWKKKGKFAPKQPPGGDRARGPILRGDGAEDEAPAEQPAGGKPPGYVDFFNLDGKTGAAGGAAGAAGGAAGGDAMAPATAAAAQLSATTEAGASRIESSLSSTEAAFDRIPGAIETFASRIQGKIHKLEASIAKLAAEGG